MAGVTLTIDDRKVQAALQSLYAVTGNLEPVYRDIGEYLLKSTDDRFIAQVDPNNQPWAKLSKKYLASKPYNQDKKLVLDGYLENEIRYQVSPNELEVGTNKIYGATHQFGRDEVNIPARPFLGFSEADKTEVLAIVNEHLQKAL